MLCKSCCTLMMSSPPHHHHHHHHQAQKPTNRTKRMVPCTSQTWITHPGWTPSPAKTLREKKFIIVSAWSEPHWTSFPMPSIVWCVAPLHNAKNSPMLQLVHECPFVKKKFTAFNIGLPGLLANHTEQAKTDEYHYLSFTELLISCLTSDLSALTSCAFLSLTAAATFSLFKQTAQA